MKLTLTEKLIKNSLVEGSLERGTRIGIKADQALMHDLNAMMTYLALESLELDKVKINLAVQYIDHNMMQADFKNDDDHRYIQDITSKLGIITARPGSGICHQLHLEHWGIPGKSLIGGDSHTVAAGGIAMLSIGVGGFDSAMVLAGETFYFTMPKIVKVELTGKLPPFVSAKNIILEVLRRIGVKGGVGKILEYTGPGVKTLNVAERSTITNMGQETGATTSVFPSDENTRQWLRAYNREKDYQPLEADDGAVYDEVIKINLSALEPLIALPHLPDNIVPLSDVLGTKVDQVMIGSCTNTALNDILSVANILKGNTVHKDVDIGLYPSTRTVIRESVMRGAYDDIVSAGVRIFEPICGGCNGNGFAPKTDGISLRTTPRNFYGRTGTKTAQVYLCSPEVAAASALYGVITDPRTLDIDDIKYELPERFLDDSNIFVMPSLSPDIVPRRGPNIKPIPPMEAMEDTIKEKVLLKLDDDITTDHICPAGAKYLPIRSNIPELSKHGFKMVDETFPNRAKEAGGGIIVAGENYGQGSSREQAAIIPRYLGIKAVIAKSFARLHLANMCNWGILPLTFVDRRDYEKISSEDILELDTSNLKENKIYTLVNKTTGEKISVQSPASQDELNYIKAGGRINLVKEKLKGIE
ncbi:aconitate hydratase [Anaerosphaera multitolerans]|uniref:Aconitate hydratase n=1 Tax=Anaerosphaera multitolerans TaxID=2487351 RepID=A0A437S4F1_9FIRM|nr:aconitate hydratase [Anaerosphaera multitolerans]RVU53893.1 aconitate hydratase [Anaerosphaera multitolerans]